VGNDFGMMLWMRDGPLGHGQALIYLAIEICDIKIREAGWQTWGPAYRLTV